MVHDSVFPTEVLQDFLMEIFYALNRPKHRRLCQIWIYNCKNGVVVTGLHECSHTFDHEFESIYFVSLPVNIGLGEIESRFQSISDECEHPFVPNIYEEGVLRKDTLVNLKVYSHL